LSRCGEQAANVRRSLRLTCKTNGFLEVYDLEWEEAGVVSLDCEVVGIGAGFGGSVTPLGAVEKASTTEVVLSGRHRV
jgi:hypothetical protein